MIRRYTLAKADLAFVRQHRGDDNRLEIALQMCLLRFRDLGTKLEIFQGLSQTDQIITGPPLGLEDGSVVSAVSSNEPEIE